jgi:hypothetical protein
MQLISQLLSYLSCVVVTVRRGTLTIENLEPQTEIDVEDPNGGGYTDEDTKVRTPVGRFVTPEDIAQAVRTSPTWSRVLASTPYPFRSRRLLRGWRLGGFAAW